MSKEEYLQTIEAAYMDRIINTLIDKWGMPITQARDVGRDLFYTFVMPVYELGGQFGLKPYADPELTALKAENERLKFKIVSLNDKLLQTLNLTDRIKDLESQLAEKDKERDDFALSYEQWISMQRWLRDHTQIDNIGTKSFKELLEDYKKSLSGY